MAAQQVAEKTEFLYGDYVVLQASQLHDCLTFEWLGDRCSPMVHVVEGGGAERKQTAAQGVVPGAPLTLSSGPYNADRHVFAIFPSSVADQKGDVDRYVTYGRTVRLLNVITNSFLCSDIDEDSDDLIAVLHRPRNIHGLVDETGVKRELWKLLPRHKLREEGERVRRNDQVFLVNVACGLYLNLTPLPADNTWAEANNTKLMQRNIPLPERLLAGFKGTDTRGAAWSILGFDKGEAVGKSVVKCLDSVVVFHKEVEGFVEATGVDEHGKGTVSLDQHKVGRGTYNILDLPYSSNAIFTIEADDPTRGGPVLLGKKKYRLKHVVSGTYLTVRTEESVGGAEIAGKKIVTITTTPSPDDPFSLVTFHALDSDSTDIYLTRTSFIRLQFHALGMWFHADLPLDASLQPPSTATASTTAVAGTSTSATTTAPTDTDKTKQLEEKTTVAVTAVSKGYLEDVLALRLTQPSLRESIYATTGPVAVMDYFDNFWANAKERRAMRAEEEEDWRGRKRRVETDTAETEEEERLAEEMVKVFQNLVSLLSDLPVQAVRGMDLASLPQPLSRVQRLLFETGMHHRVFSSLQVPLSGGGLTLEGVASTDSHLLEVYKLGFRLIEQMIRGAKDLAVGLAQYIPFLEAQLRHELNIASALMQIVSDNRAILESLHQRQLESFCYLIPQYGRSPTYLTLLSACCTCDGDPVPTNQSAIVRCLSGMSGDDSDPHKPRPSVAASLRIFYPLRPHQVDGVHIKPYTTFPPSTPRRVFRFLRRYEQNCTARARGRVDDDGDLSSSESSLSSAESDIDEEGFGAGLLYDDYDPLEEEELLEGAGADLDGLLSPTSLRNVLYRTKREPKQSWTTYVESTALASSNTLRATLGCWVWRCEVPRVACTWSREWFTFHGGTAYLHKFKGGPLMRSLSVVDILQVSKGGVSGYDPPSHFRTFGFSCTLKTTSPCGLHHTVLLCAESMWERNELLSALRGEVRLAEMAIEGTKALSGDPLFAGRTNQLGARKTASLQSHMKALLRRQREYKGDEEHYGGLGRDNVVRVAIGSRYDTPWEPLASFIRHHDPQKVAYFTAQLVLLRKVCHGGHPEALRWVQRMLPREVIREGISLACDHTSAPRIRAAFADLAVALFLTPDTSNLSRNQVFLASLKAAVEEHLRRPMKKLKKGSVDTTYLINEHHFTSAVLRLCHRLVCTEQYTAQEIAGLVPPLVRILSRFPPNVETHVVKEQPLKASATGTEADATEGSLEMGEVGGAIEQTIPELQFEVMETKMQACKVLFELLQHRESCTIVKGVLGCTTLPGVQEDDDKADEAVAVLDQLTSVLLQAILHTGHENLYLTALHLTFSMLSSKIGDELSDPHAQTRLARILKHKLREGNNAVLLAFFRLLQGGTGRSVSATSTTLAVMKTITRMVYLDDDPIAMGKVQNDLDRLGLAPMVSVLIESKDEVMVKHALDLMIALMHGGNAAVQESMANYFLSRNDEALFVTLRNRILGSISQIREAENNKVPNRLALYRSNNLLHIREVLRLLQLFTEGHNFEMQEYLRTQPDNVVSYNLVKESFSFLCTALTFEFIDDFTQSIIVQAFSSLTEYCQGPCPENQHLLIKSNIGAQLNAVLAGKFLGLSKEEINEIRSAALLCVQSVLEGIPHTDTFALAVRRTINDDLLRRTVEEGWKDVRCESSLEVAFNVCILLKMLAVVGILEGTQGFAFLDAMTGSIEICRDGKLERIYFRIPTISANLSTETKDELLRSVNRTTPTGRISDFFYRAEGLIFEIEYYQKEFYEPRPGLLDLLRIAQQILHRMASLWHYSMVAVAFVTNTILIASAEYVAVGDAKKLTVHEGVQRVITFLAIGQVMLTACILSEFLVSKAPLIVFRKQKQQRLEAQRQATQMLSSREMLVWWESPENEDPRALPPGTGRSLKPDSGTKRKVLPVSQGSEISKVLEQKFGLKNTLWCLRWDTTFLFHLSCLVMALLGVTVSPFCLTYHLLGVITKSPVLLNVLTAITRHGRALLLSGLLGAVIVYFFAVAAFILFREKFRPVFEGSDQRPCDTLLQCFWYLLINAVRAGGGVGDLIVDHSWNDRPYVIFGLMSDFLFFVIIIVILLNIISGVIIDTFARLREEKQTIEDDIRGKCFICGIESTQFDRQAEGFEQHVKGDHNMWLYIYFLHHLMKKDVSEFTGQESFVYSMIQKNDLSFFPLNKAIALEGKRDEEDHLQAISTSDKDVQGRLQHVEGKFQEIHQAWAVEHHVQKEQVERLCEMAVNAVVATHKVAEEQVTTHDTLPVSPPPESTRRSRPRRGTVTRHEDHQGPLSPTSPRKRNFLLTSMKSLPPEDRSPPRSPRSPRHPHGGPSFFSSVKSLGGMSPFRS